MKGRAKWGEKPQLFSKRGISPHIFSISSSSFQIFEKVFMKFDASLILYRRVRYTIKFSYFFWYKRHFDFELII